MKILKKNSKSLIESIESYKNHSTTSLSEELELQDNLQPVVDIVMADAYENFEKVDEMIEEKMKDTIKASEELAKATNAGLIESFAKKVDENFSKTDTSITFKTTSRDTLKELYEHSKENNYKYQLRKENDTYIVECFITEEILDEKLPKDLAKVYNRSNWGDDLNDRRTGRYDYENADYTELTADEAIAYRKEKKDISQLRFIIDGELFTYLSDGTPQHSLHVYRDKTYTNRNGGRVSDVRKMPFNYVCKIADKIYWTNEKEKLKDEDQWNERRTNRQLGVTTDDGKHTGKSWDEQQLASEKRYLDDYKARLAKLEAAWEEGTITRLDYEKRKENLLRYIKDTEKEIAKYVNRVKDSKAQKRYQYTQDVLQKNLKRFKELKREIGHKKYSLNYAETKLADIKEKGSDSNEYSFYSKQLADYRRKLAEAQRMVAYYENKLSQDQINIDIEEAEGKVNDLMSSIEDMEKELSKLLKKDKKESLVVEEIVEEPILDEPIEEPAIVEIPEELPITPVVDKEVRDSGLSSMINALIKDEWNTIDTYKSILGTITDEDEEVKNRIQPILQDIIDEEMVHVGQLQALLTTFSPEAENIKVGEEEAKTQLEDNKVEEENIEDVE